MWHQHRGTRERHMTHRVRAMVSQRVREIAREGAEQPELWSSLRQMTDDELRAFIASKMEPHPAQ